MSAVGFTTVPSAAASRFAAKWPQLIALPFRSHRLGSLVPSFVAYPLCVAAGPLAGPGRVVFLRWKTGCLRRAR